jgi:sporulation protein YlmC with PRC-barrel domain
MLDAGLDLLDRQILDREDMQVGKVDDVEFEIDADGKPVLTALLLGPMAWGPRLGGRLGTWVVAVARRLRPETDPGPVRIEARFIRRLGTTVDLTISAEESGAQRLEHWLRTKLVERIPGAEHAAG